MDIELNENRSNENVVEWLTGQKTISITFSQKKYVTKARRLAERCPDEVNIIAENADGSIFVHAPLSYFKFSKPRQLSDEQKEATKERFALYKEQNA